MSLLLSRFLSSPRRPPGTLNILELQGFLFAMSCAPVLVKPSEWLPLIFDDQDAAYASAEEAQSVVQALMELYNEINDAVRNGSVTLPADVTLVAEALDNVGETAPLGQWSRGFLLGHDWLREPWAQYIPDDLDEELGSCLMVLTFFSSRTLAQSYCQEMGKSRGHTLEDFASQMLAMVENAIRSYSLLGTSIYTALMDQDRQHTSIPYRNDHKTGRNDPCPCGSGKKFKKCCMH